MMGKHFDKLQTGNPDREVSEQEMINVLYEYFDEAIELLRQTKKKLWPEEPPSNNSQKGKGI